jgi:hypothetical protein
MGVCQLGRALSSVERGDRCSPIHKRTRDETTSCARRQAATLAENCSGTAPRSRPSRQSAGSGRPAPWVGAAHSAQRSWVGNPSRTVWHQSLLLPGCGRASDRCQPLDAPPPICDASACSASAPEHFLTNVVGLTANTWNWILPAADSFATGLRKAHASRSSCICTPSFPMHSIKLNISIKPNKSHVVDPADFQPQLRSHVVSCHHCSPLQLHGACASNFPSRRPSP